MNNFFSSQLDCKNKTGFILAKNWDRLGGRVHEILNGFLLAKVLKLEFRFIWPEEKRFPEMSEQINIFSEDFIKKHRIYEDQIIDYEEILLPKKFNINLKEFKSQIQTISNKYYLRPSSFFEIPVFIDEDSYSLFKDCAEEVFSPKIRELDKKIKIYLKEKGVSRVLHLRYGDLVTGSFRQYPDVHKYFPFCLAYKILSTTNAYSHTIIISDTPEITIELCKLNDTFYRSGDLIAEKRNENEFDSLILDLLIMKNCKTVIAPSLSAFSRLGAHLGGNELKIISVDNQITNINDMLNWINKNFIYKNLANNLAGLLFARDIAQLMNKHSIYLDLRDWYKIALIATNADPNFVIGCAQMAVVQSFYGKHSKASKIIKNIKELAFKSMPTHHDPLTYLTVVEIFCLTIQIYQQLVKKNRTKSLYLFNEVSKLQKTLKTLNPFQIYLKEIIPSLDISLLTLESEIKKLDSETDLSLQIKRLKNNSILRKIFLKKKKFLKSEEIFENIYRSLDKNHFLVLLVKTLEILLKKLD